MNVYHEEGGLVFRKIQADTGISYLSVPVEEVKVGNPELLVRHGDPESGSCGYYPLRLIFTNRDVRIAVAAKSGKRPPHEGWVVRTRNALTANGISIH
ncbi:hypothetical protein D3C85_15870 [compost metagenome]